MSINDEGTKVFIDDELESDKAARRTGFVVTGRSATKDENTNYLKVATDGTQVRFDNDDSKAARRSGFVVTGRSATKDGAESDVLEVTADSTRVYVNGGGSKSGFGVEGKAGAGVKSGFAVTEKGANGNAGYMDVTAANFFAGYNAGKNTNLHYDLGGEVPDGIFDIETDPDILDWSPSTNFLLGGNNTFIGNNAGYSNDNGMNNVFLGVNAGYSLSGIFSFNNVFLGTSAGKNLKNMTGTVAIGNSAGRGLESYQPGEEEWISGDVFIGDKAGFSNTSGSSNVFVGSNAGKANTTGGNNVYIGSSAGYQNTTSWGNTLINNSGLRGTGNDNIIIGGVSAGTDLSFGDNNIIIGLDALWTSYYDKDASNRLVIGTWITGNGSRIKMEKDLLVGGKLTIASHTTPSANEYYDLGSDDRRFRTLYAKSINLYRADGKYTGNVYGSLIPQEEDQNLGGVSPNNSNYIYRWNAIYAKTLDLTDGATIANKLTVSSDGTTINGKLTVSGTSGLEINGGVYPWTGTGSYNTNLGKKDNRWNYVYANYFNGAQSVTAPYIYANKKFSLSSSAEDMATQGLDINLTTPAKDNNYYGGSFIMKGDATGSVYGIYSTSYGKGTNYGIYAAASGGTTNWAGYFNGDVNVSGNMTVGNLTPSADDSKDLGSSSLRWRYAYFSQSISAYGVKPATAGKNIQFFGGLEPYSNNMYDVGASSYRWKKIYLIDGVDQSSDARLKTNIKNIENALQKVLTLNGVTFNWRAEEFPDKNFDNESHIGVIAQEVEKVFPQLVSNGDDGFKGVMYENFAPILIEAIKDLKAEKDELQTTVEKQQQQIDELKRLVEELLKK